MQGPTQVPDRPPQSDVLTEFSFYKLFLSAENVRWKIADLDWETMDPAKVAPWNAPVARLLAASEVTTHTATRSLLRFFEDDFDFSQWLSIWFYEETKHPFALMKWLKALGHDFSSSFIGGNREAPHLPSSKIRSLCINIIAEVSASLTYQSFFRAAEEPVLRTILRNIGGDEMRHATSFLLYAAKAIRESDDPCRDRRIALETLLYGLLASDQHHPVHEGLRRIKALDLSHEFRAQLESSEAMKERILLSQFSQLAGEEIASQKDLLRLLRGGRPGLREENAL